MRNIRIIDEAGNKRDHEMEVVPRIGEHIIATYGAGGAPQLRHFRVQDVIYNLDNAPEHQISIVVARGRRIQIAGSVTGLVGVHPCIERTG